MKKLLACILLWALAFAAHADRPAFNDNDFARIPVQHEGRIKPLDSFARIFFKQISGSSEEADARLAHVLFAPGEAMQERLFLVNEPTARRLSLSPRKDAKYDFRTLAHAYSAEHLVMEALNAKDSKTLSPEEQELLTLYAKVNAFADLMQSVSWLEPQPNTSPAVRKALGADPEKEITLLDLLKMRERLHDPKLDARLSLMEALNRNNTLFRVIPPAAMGQEEWLSPWAVITKNAGSPLSAQLFREWQTLARAWREGDEKAWRDASHALREAGEASPQVRPWALWLEVTYNRIDPMGKSLFVYAFGILFAASALFARRQKWADIAYGVLGAGAVVQGLGLLARMAILMRPPVSTLYESMLYVSFASVAIELWLELRRRAADGLVIAGLAGLLLLAGSSFFAPEGDTLGVLIAVLNTNFWLAMHVICITTGYGCALVTGMMSHLYLAKRAVGQNTQGILPLYHRIHRVALIALFFTAVGTMLGGIWADQSWGRFWGWDPKENGALAIVLWLIWMIHGRIAGQLATLGFAISGALLNVVVAFAWIGVNLLSVGLHSYGFTDAAATGLLAFTAVELAFVLISTLWIRKQERSAHA